MNKAQRQAITNRKFAQRLRNHRINPAESPGNYYGFKTSGTPCSCWVCRDEKYKRAPKYKRIES